MALVLTGKTGGESSWERCVRDQVSEVQLLVFDSKKQNILATRVDGSWQLPRWFSEGAFYRSLDSMRQAAEGVFGSEYKFNVLRCIWHQAMDIEHDNTEYELTRSVVVLEARQAIDQVPRGVEWISIGDASRLHSEEEASMAVEEDLGFVSRGDEPELRVGWARPGWHKRMAGWMCDQLKERGFSVEEESVERLSASPWGTVLCARAGCEVFYMKSSPCFCDEAAISSILASCAPLHVASPLVVDKSTRTFITRDHGESVSWSSLEEGEKVQMLKDLAQMQKASVGKVDELREAGVQVYDAKWLAENLDVLLDHEELLFMSEDDSLKKLKREREQVREAVRTLEDLSKGMPMCLVHGDLRSGNFYRSKGESGRFGFFDWDCAFIGHPCFDIVDYGWEEGRADSYLEEWSEFQSVRELKEVLHLVDRLESLPVCFRSLHELLHIEKLCRGDLRECIRLQFQVLSHCVSARK